MIRIKRSYHKHFTMGVGSCEGFNFVTLELPDKDNQRNISCIPAGRYKAKKRISPGKGYEVIEFIDVPNRTYIQCHRGNYTSQLLGCVLFAGAAKAMGIAQAKAAPNTTCGRWV